MRTGYEIREGSEMIDKRAHVTSWMRDPNRIRLSSGETISLRDYHAATSDTGRCYCYLCLRDRECS